MNSIGLICRRQNVLRSTVAMFVVSLLCLTSYPDIAAAQASKAIPLLGKFAMTVVSGVATNFVWSKVAEAKPEAESKTPPTKSAPLPKSPPEPQISGYRFILSWQVPNDGLYSGTIIMRGVYGSFRVTTPAGTIIDQDMKAVPAPGNRAIFLVGSNPRYAPGSIRLENHFYDPDSFSLIELASGDWTITDTCDRKQCGSVRVIEASTF
jgi:hypothetical protein